MHDGSGGLANVQAGQLRGRVGRTNSSKPLRRTKYRSKASSIKPKSMKFLHTADWHLGNTFHGYDRAAEFRHFLDWLVNALRAEQPDALLVAGDVYDTPNPSAAAEEMLYDFLLRATEAVPGLQVVLIAGNHDSAGRIDAPAALLKRHNIYVRGALPLLEDGSAPDYEQLILPLSSRTAPEAEAVCLAVPFLRPADYPAGMSPAEGLRYVFRNLQDTLRHSPFRGLPIVAVAHFYATGAEISEGEHSERLVVGGQDCVPAEVVGAGVNYTALGHLHKAQQVKCAGPQTAYAGSPLPLSFSERTYERGVSIVEFDAEGLTGVRRLRYEPLRALMALPARGAARPEEILDLVAALPQREAGDDGRDWPYLEIRVLEQRPEPSLLHRVAEALSDRAVHFCRMVRELPDSGTKGDTAPAKTSSLQALSPLEMATRVFRDIYHNDLPEEMRTRFLQAEQAAQA